MRQSFNRFSILICSIFAVAACSLTTGPSTSSYGAGPRRILLIGNSLTAANDMPSMVVTLAESAKVSRLPSVVVDWISNYALIDHWTDGNASGLITSGHYDLVVLQQGPSGLHPSPLGSYAVALSIVGMLYDRSKARRS
jgi:hypothetical protein